MAKKPTISKAKKGGGDSGPVELVFVQPAQLKNLQAGLSITAKEYVKIAKPALDEYGQILVQSMQREIPRDMGYTAGGLDWKVSNKGELRIMWNKPTNRPKDLIEWLIYGTGIYGPRKKPIVPVRAPALRFKTKDGRWHSKKSVRGMKPDNFVEDAWDNTVSYRRSLAQKIGALIVRSITDSRGKGGPAVPNRN